MNSAVAFLKIDLHFKYIIFLSCMLVGSLYSLSPFSTNVSDFKCEIRVKIFLHDLKELFSLVW